MTFRNIPVFLNAGDPIPIGFGSISDGELTIVVKNELIVDGITRLVQAEDIRELYLGVGFPISSTVTERTRQ